MSSVQVLKFQVFKLRSCDYDDVADYHHYDDGDDYDVLFCCYWYDGCDKYCCDDAVDGTDDEGGVNMLPIIV